LRALAQDGHVVTLVSFADPAEVIGDHSALRGVVRELELVPTPETGGIGGADSVLARIRALAAPMPFGAWRLRSEPFQRALERRIEEDRPGLILCDGIYNVQNLPMECRVPVLLNKDDVAHLIVERYLDVERNPLRRTYAALEARKVRRWERDSCERVEIVLACSEVDREVLQRLCPTAKVLVAPNVVDVDHYVHQPQEEPATVLFQGGMDWHPNRDAVEFCAAAILPELRRLVPGVRFRVAGREHPVETRERLTAQGIELTGFVDDIRVEIARATVCVVPLRIGSGTRLKILEAAAMEKAIVSTSIGAEGLRLVDGEEIVIADVPSEFARAVADLMGNKERRRRMGHAARLRIEKEYSLEALQCHVRDALGQMSAVGQGPVARGAAGIP
jgi:glycosyltransferase involved in cell wall biosynthesis